VLLLTLNNMQLTNTEYLKTLLIIKKFSGLWIIISFSIIANKFLSSVSATFSKHAFFVKYPINSYLQLIKLIIIVISAILVICTAFNLSPWGILSGVGALGAILLLVFKDTILGFVASIQVYSGNLLKEGDWIELKALDIDGEVMEVGLHRVKVKAWDNTIATFPTSKFLELTFKNWRGMKDSGGRRIKRKIILTMSSIKFVDPILKKKLANLTLLENYLKKKEVELEKENKKRKIGDINRRTLTNIGCFRIYVKYYLEQHPLINKKMTLLVRQLPINQFGLPIEIYTFTSTTDWNAYEDIQSDIFDHIIASTKYFDLDVYQEPSSIDFKSKINDIILKS
jgi:miniconductance mechanosensitive channel